MHSAKKAVTAIAGDWSAKNVANQLKDVRDDAWKIVELRVSQ